MCVCVRVCVLACTVFQSRISSILHFARRISAKHGRYGSVTYVHVQIFRANTRRKRRRKEVEGRNPECCLRVPVGDNLKVRKGESIRYTGKMKSRGRRGRGGGRGRRKNGARTGYRITVYRTNISLLLDQTFFFYPPSSSLFLFPFRGLPTKGKHDESEETRTSNNAHLEVAKDRLKSTRGRAAYPFWWGYGISHAAPQHRALKRSVHWARGRGKGEGGSGEGRGGGGGVEARAVVGRCERRGGTRVAR